MEDDRIADTMVKDSRLAVVFEGWISERLDPTEVWQKLVQLKEESIIRAKAEKLALKNLEAVHEPSNQST